MTRKEQLEALAAVLQMAADKANTINPTGKSKLNREAALAVQIEGIAMEYHAIAASLPGGRASGEQRSVPNVSAPDQENL